jgi:flagellar biogenesis protein FliO
MDKSILELAQEVTGVQFIMALLFIIALIVLAMTQKQKLLKYLNKWRKTKNEEEDFHALVYGLKNSMIELGKKIEENRTERENERTHDREDSRKIREEMYKVMNRQSAQIEKQSEQIEELKNITLGIQKKNSETKRAEIKEKIERIYRECHPAMTCTDMQLETLKELIDQYEKHEGDNSFVHSTVQKEMYSWHVINEIKSSNDSL